MFSSDNFSDSQLFSAALRLQATAIKKFGLVAKFGGYMCYCHYSRTDYIFCKTIYGRCSKCNWCEHECTHAEQVQCDAEMSRRHLWLTWYMTGNDALEFF